MTLFAYKWEVWRLSRLQRKTRRESLKKRLEYQNDKTKTRDDYLVLDAEEYHEMKEFEEAAGCIHSDRISYEASKFDIEIPQDTLSWEYTDAGERRFLNGKARAALRKQIAEAKKQSTKRGLNGFCF